MQCKSCIKAKHSEEWVLSKEMAKKAKRRGILLLVFIFLWVSTAGAFLRYVKKNSCAVDYGKEFVFVTETEEVVESANTTGGAIGASRKRKPK
jgi:hypothetical protein